MNFHRGQHVMVFMFTQCLWLPGQVLAPAPENPLSWLVQVTHPVTGEAWFPHRSDHNFDEMRSLEYHAERVLMT